MAFQVVETFPLIGNFVVKILFLKMGNLGFKISNRHGKFVRFVLKCTVFTGQTIVILFRSNDLLPNFT